MKRLTDSQYIEALKMSMPDFEDDDSDGSTERGVATKTRPKTKKPSMYRVLLMNDDRWSDNNYAGRSQKRDRGVRRIYFRSCWNQGKSGDERR